jgi:hypothetical protein
VKIADIGQLRGAIALVVAIVVATLAVDHTYVRRADASQQFNQLAEASALDLTNLRIEYITDQLEQLAWKEQRDGSLAALDLRRRELLIEQLRVLYLRQQRLLDSPG